MKKSLAFLISVIGISVSFNVLAEHCSAYPSDNEDPILLKNDSPITLKGQRVQASWSKGNITPKGAIGTNYTITLWIGDMRTALSSGTAQLFTIKDSKTQITIQCGFFN